MPADSRLDTAQVASSERGGDLWPMTGYLNQYRTPWWWEQVPCECREYDREASWHFAVSYLSLGLWWCVQPHTPVVWWMQW